MKKQTGLYMVALVAAIGGFNYGYDCMIMSSAILFLKEQFSLSAIQEGSAMTSAWYGTCAGLCFTGWLSDRIGRKKTLFVAGLLFIVSAIGTAIPKTFYFWYSFRIIGGIGGGVALVVSPMYLSEISPSHLRGRLVFMNQMAISISILIASIVAYFLAPLSNAWCWMFGSAVPVIALMLIGILFIPESPRWLMQRKRKKEAADIMTAFYGKKYVQQEIQSIENSIGKKERGRFSELFKYGMSIPIVVAVGLACFQQLSGGNTVLYYAPTIFKEAGIVQNTSAIGNSVILNSMVIIFTLIGIFLVDKLGRRPLLLYGAIGLVIGQVLLGTSFHLELSPYYALFFMILTIGAYVMSFAPLAWLIMSEIFPTRIRACAMAVTTISMQISALTASGFFPVIRDYSQKIFGSISPVFWLFACICSAAFVFCYKYVPETRGKTLEEIEMYFDREPEYILT